MNIRRLMFVAVPAIAMAVAVCVVHSIYWDRTLPELKAPSKLLAAVQAFAHDQKARGQPLPPFVSLRELIGGGYVATNEVRAFDGMEVSFATEQDETLPQEILIHVRLPDGTQIGAMGDGSVRQLPKSFNRTNRANLRK